MAKEVLKNARIEVNGVVLSDHANEVSINTSKPEVDVTSFGASASEILAGIMDATMTATFFSDYAAGSVDATLWPLYLADSTFTVKIRKDAGAISATNPEWVMTARLLEYNPLSGGVGAAAQTPVTFRNAAQTGIVRNTS